MECSPASQSRLILSINHPQSSINECWRSEKILIELDPEESSLQILVRTELRGEQMSNLCWLIFAAVDSLVKEWYNLSVRPNMVLLRLGLSSNPFPPGSRLCSVPALSGFT